MLAKLHQGKSSQSELFNSLKAHLNNKNRLQPFIGLGSIIECVNGDTLQRDAFYMCEVCLCRLDKADMRNHIMGSLHRYNYIKAWHSELVSEWGEDSCLSKLAWPLMDIAKKIEEKEGPGNVKVVELGKVSYQHMEKQSNNAKNVIHFLRDKLKESEPEISETISSKMWEQTKSPSQRIVLYSPRKKSEKSSEDIQKLSQHRKESSLPDTFNRSSSSSFLSGYTGQVPLTGLVRVVECKSEDGQTYCFLCHCCRIRSNKHDFIDHLTSTSHITNYLMETHPEQLESMDINDCYQVELLAQNLKKEQQTTAVKVVQIPVSLCIQMLGRSYHWCVKTLEGNNSDFTVKCNRDIKRQKITKFLNQKCPRKSNTAQLQQEKKKKQKTPKNNPVFKVTLPVTQGSLLIKRTSFCKDDIPLSFTHSPAADLSRVPSTDYKYSPNPQGFNLDCPSKFFDSTSENASHRSQYQPSDFSQYSEQGMYSFNDPLINQFENQNVDSIANIDSKVKIYADNLNTRLETENAKGYSEYGPTYNISEGTSEKDESAVGKSYYHQRTQYLTPECFHQQQMYSSVNFVGGYRTNLQTGHSFSNNNNIILTDHSQAHSGSYTDTHQYSSYQLSTSGWGTYLSQAPGQTPCYGACCFPSYTGAGYASGISGNPNGTGSSNAMYYPMSNFYSNHWCQY